MLGGNSVSEGGNADGMVGLGEGRVAETGTHSELLARNGLYAALERAQGQRASLEDDLGRQEGEEPA